MPPESPGEGPPCLFQLLGAPGIHPWAGGRLPPVSASTRLLLCVLVSPLLCLIRTLSLGLGLSPSRRASSQTFTPSQLQRPRNFRGTVFNPGQHPSFRDVGCFCLIFFSPILWPRAVSGFLIPRPGSQPLSPVVEAALPVKCLKKFFFNFFLMCILELMQPFLM